MFNAFATGLGSQIQGNNNGNNNGGSIVNASICNMCATNFGSKSEATTMARALPTPVFATYLWNLFATFLQPKGWSPSPPPNPLHSN